MIFALHPCALEWEAEYADRIATYFRRLRRKSKRGEA